MITCTALDRDHWYKVKILFWTHAHLLCSSLQTLCTMVDRIGMSWIVNLYIMSLMAMMSSSMVFDTPSTIPYYPARSVVDEPRSVTDGRHSLHSSRLSFILCWATVSIVILTSEVIFVWYTGTASVDANVNISMWSTGAAVPRSCTEMLIKPSWM